MVEARYIRLVVTGTLVFVLGCRALNGVGTGAGVDGGDDAAGATGPVGNEPPTRLEPPIVTPAPDVMVETIAGSATGGAADGVGAAAQFDNPVGVFLDPSGAILVTEYDGGRLRKIPPSGPSVTLATGFLDSFALLATEDAIYVQTDRDRNGGKGPTTGTLWKVPLTGGVPEVFLESGGRPRGLARLLDGRVVMTDRERHVVSILNLADGVVTPLAGSGTAGFVNGRGAEAQFNDPYGVAVLPDGSVLVADAANNVIRKVTLEGDVSSFAGDGYPGMKDDPDKQRARFDFPQDLAVDAAGNVYVTDLLNHRIRRITSTGGVETVAGDGTQGYADGPGATAKFFGQEQIDISPDGKTLYVSDGNRGEGEAYHRIRKITFP